MLRSVLPTRIPVLIPCLFRDTQVSTAQQSCILRVRAHACVPVPVYCVFIHGWMRCGCVNACVGHGAGADIVEAEYFLMEELKFNLLVFHAYRPMERLIKDAKDSNHAINVMVQDACKP